MDADPRHHEVAPPMRGRNRFALAIALAILSGCAPYVGHVRSRHAHEFGCQERWVSVREDGGGRWTATGCGFQSEWVCVERDCQMRDHRSYGMDTP